MWFYSHEDSEMVRVWVTRSNSMCGYGCNLCGQRGDCHAVSRKCPPKSTGINSSGMCSFSPGGALAKCTAQRRKRALQSQVPGAKVSVVSGRRIGHNGRWKKLMARVYCTCISASVSIMVRFERSPSHCRPHKTEDQILGCNPSFWKSDIFSISWKATVPLTEVGSL